MPTVKIFRFPPPSHLVTFLFLIPALLQCSLHADPSSAELAKTAAAAYQENKLADAAQALKTLLEKFPESREAGNARYLLGVVYYNTGKYADAIPLLGNTKDFDKKNLPIAAYYLGLCHYSLAHYDECFTPLDTAAKSDNQEIIPFAIYYYARAKMDAAFKMLEKNPAGAKSTATDGLAKIRELTEKFPNSDLITDAVMTKANLLIATGDYDQAASELEALHKRPGAEDMGEDIDYLLGYVLTQNAKTLRETFKREEAAEVLTRARETYERLSHSENLVLANDADFKLASLEMEQAGLETEPAKRSEAFQNAIKSFHGLRSKVSIIASQKQRIAAIVQKIGQAVGDKARVDKLTRARLREEQKLASVEQNPEQAVDAWMKIADCYMQIQKYDEVRIVGRYLLPFAKDEQERQVRTFIIISYALQGNQQAAEQQFSEFTQKFPNDPAAKSVPFFLGLAFLQQKQYEQAIQRFDEFLKNVPDSPLASQVPQKKAEAYLAMKKTSEALKSFDDFIRDAQSGKLKVAPEEIENAQRLRAYAYIQAQKIPEALQAFDFLAKKAKSSSVREDAAYQIGNMYFSSKDYDKAVAAYQDFIKNFPDSPNAVRAAYFIAVTLDGAKKIPEAIAAYRAVIQNYPNPDLKQACYEKIWHIYQAQQDYDNMVKVQEEQIAAFPDSDRKLSILFERGKYLDETAKKPDEAIKTYQSVAQAYKSLPPAAQTSESGKKLAGLAGSALLRISDIYRRQIARLGNPKALKDPQLQSWKDTVQNAYQVIDQALQDYGNSSALPFALQRMTELQLLRVHAGLSNPEEATTYFSKLAGAMSNEAASTQVLLARAGFVYETGAGSQALLLYKEVFDKITDAHKVLWQDYDRYGSLLLENKDWKAAQTNFQKLQSDYATPPAAQAAALYGLGAAAAGNGNLAQAEVFFKELKDKYAWSEKILNAEYTRGLAARDKGDYAGAFKIWKDIMISPRNNNEIKARTMVEFGKTLRLMADKNLPSDEVKQPNGKPDLNIYELAASYSIKPFYLYADQATIVPEGLYNAIDIYSNKLSTLTNNPKSTPKDEARKLFDTLSEKFPTSPWTGKAQAILH